MSLTLQYLVHPRDNLRDVSALLFGVEEICAGKVPHFCSGISFVFIWASGGTLFVILLVVNLGVFFHSSFKYSDQAGSQLFC